MTGIVFDIKEFSVHDGPGGRVTVFMKGCPLRCLWCHNPEGLEKQPQLMYKENMCTHCGKCFEPCNHTECKPYGRCLNVCLNNCLEVAGKEYSVDELYQKLILYKDFLKSVNGGITFSGGEPLMQSDFVLELATKLKQQNIHLAIQTSGFAPQDAFKKVIDKMDYVMMDIKLVDRELHKKYTGVYNDVILKNFEYLKSSGKEYIVRVPLIPDITDTSENLSRIADLTKDSDVELLRYNKLAGAKYKSLGMEYTLADCDTNSIDTSIFKNAKLS